MKTQHLILGILSSILFLTNASALSFGGLSISPTYPNEEKPEYFVFELKPGESGEEFVTLTNQTNDKQEVLVYPVDTKINNQNNIVLESRDESRDQVGKWVTFPDGEEYTLNPKESKNIKFTISIPQDAEKKDYVGGIALENKNPNGTKEIQSGAVIKTNARVGIRTFVKVTDNPQPVAKLKITPPNEWTKYYLYASIGLFVIVVIVIAAQNFKKKK